MSAPASTARPGDARAALQQTTRLARSEYRARRKLARELHRAVAVRDARDATEGTETATNDGARKTVAYVVRKTRARRDAEAAFRCALSEARRAVNATTGEKNV